MEKIGTKTIEINPGIKLDFDVYPCNCKVGDTVWFDNGVPVDDGNIVDHCYMHGKVIYIDPNHHRVYDNGEKFLGSITIEIEDNEIYNIFNGHHFMVPFKNIIYEKPKESILSELQNLVESCKAFENEMAEMDKNIEFLLNEYKTNKRYFRQEPGRCTVEDVIKTVFEFAWAASKNYFS